MKTDIYKKRLLQFADRLALLSNRISRPAPIKIDIHPVDEEPFSTMILLWPFDDMAEWHPNEWCYDFYGSPVLIDIEEGASTIHSAIDWFGLNLPEMLHLFAPFSQRTQEYGGSQLLPGTRADVLSNHIVAFVKNKYH